MTSWGQPRSGVQYKPAQCIDSKCVMVFQFLGSVELQGQFSFFFKNMRLKHDL